MNSNDHDAHSDASAEATPAQPPRATATAGRDPELSGGGTRTLKGKGPEAKALVGCLSETGTAQANYVEFDSFLAARKEMAQISGFLLAMQKHIDEVREDTRQAVTELLAEIKQFQELKALYLSGQPDAMDALLGFIMAWEKEEMKPIFFTRFVPHLLARYVCNYVRKGAENVKPHLPPAYYERLTSAADTFQEFFNTCLTPPNRQKEH